MRRLATAISLAFVLTSAGGCGQAMQQADGAAPPDTGSANLDAPVETGDASGGMMMPDLGDAAVFIDMAVGTDLAIDAAEGDATCPGRLGCACTVMDGCNPGLVCDAKSLVCRVPLDCMSGFCGPHRTCTPMVGADGICEQSCDPNYKLDALSGTCGACVSLGCTAEPCDPQNQMFAQCIANNRGCSVSGMAVVCGDCRLGFIEDMNKNCVATPACGGAQCNVMQYCDNSNGMPTCAARPCAKVTDAATSHGMQPMCADCSGITCKGLGLTGRVWPYTSKNGSCLCETSPGYFLPLGTTTTAYACDADGDGWVRNDGAEALNGADVDYAANARCTLDSVSSVILEDEYGLSQQYIWCGGIEIAQPGHCMGGGAGLAMHLIEPFQNDIPRGGGADSPSYGNRQLRPEELTWLTKACVSAAADYDGDTQSDYLETQTATLPGKWTAEEAALHQFSYFVELYVGSFEPVMNGAHTGNLRIRERSRCDIGFPLHYDPAKSMNPAMPTDDPYWFLVGITGNPNAAGTEYWRNCQRNRDTAFSMDPTLTGFDFARFDCAAGAGACPLLPPARPTIDASMYNPLTATSEIRGHGLCNLYDAKGVRHLPKDGLWRGMQHHSQFKCVSVVAGQPAADLSEKNLVTDFQVPGAPWQFNSCSVVACDPKGPPCQKATGGGLTGFDPIVQCKAVAEGNVMAGAVGWAARNFAAGGNPVAGGCMNEELSWQYTDKGGALQSELCPYPIYFSSIAQSNQQVTYQGRLDASFGRYSCFGDSKNFLWDDNPMTVTPPWAVLCWDVACPNVSEVAVWR